MTRLSAVDIQSMKNQEEAIGCLTAYSTPMAATLDLHVDLLLVGDSIGMVLYGMENTLGVDLEMMIRHGQAVMRGAKTACVIVDMPFGTYEESPEQAYRNAARVVKETGCDGVKLEGGADMAATIEYLVSRNIPVMGHIGLLPQSVIKEGGYKIKGRTKDQETALLNDAKAVEEAGAFSFVIEGTVDDVSAKITDSVSIPTIGIGASSACDGQILVSEDMLGISVGHQAKFVKHFASLSENIDKAVSQYAKEVRTRTFPTQDHIYTRPQEVTPYSKAS